MPAGGTVFGELLESDDSAYVLSHDLRLVAVNAGFRRFASQNGADGLGERSLGLAMASVIGPVLSGFYLAGFKRALLTGQHWEHDYECSSGELFRLCRMLVQPVDGGALVVVHSVRFETPHTREVRAPEAARYVANGQVRMCAHCRRVEETLLHERWDWVPAYLRAEASMRRYCLCPTCAPLYRHGARND
jgi:hypothetical protein